MTKQVAKNKSYDALGSQPPLGPFLPMTALNHSLTPHFALNRDRSLFVLPWRYSANKPCDDPITPIEAEEKYEQALKSDKIAA